MNERKMQFKYLCEEMCCTIERVRFINFLWAMIDPFIHLSFLHNNISLYVVCTLWRSHLQLFSNLKLKEVILYLFCSNDGRMGGVWI